MTGEILRNILRVVFLLLLQGLIVNRLDLWDGMVLPQLYIFAILMLPIETPRILTLVIALLVGIVADMFTGTPGMHASACLVLGFIQPHYQKMIAPREGYEFGQEPTVQSLGLSWYLSYAIILVIIHHFVLFYLEVFRFADFFTTLSRVLLSSIGTVILLVIGQYLIFSQKPSQR